MTDTLTKIVGNQQGYDKFIKGKMVKENVVDITACFHPNNPKSYPGSYGMLAYAQQVKKNNSMFKFADRVGDLAMGGMIVFASTVNAVDGIDDEMKALLSEYQESFGAGYFRETVDSYRQEKGLEGIGYTLGHGFSGRYVNGDDQFDDNSFTVDIAGVDSETLQGIAEDLCHNFSQQSVLVRDYNENKTYLVNGNRSTTEDNEEVSEQNEVDNLVEGKINMSDIVSLSTKLFKSEGK